MSICIYNAYRFPLSRLNEATDVIHEAQRGGAYEFFCRTVNRMGQKVIKSVYRGEIPDFLITESGFQWWTDGRFVYCIFIGFEPNLLPDWFEDYHYQDQTDRPDNISQRSYAARKKKWTQIGAFLPFFANPRRFYHASVVKQTAYEFAQKWLTENNTTIDQ